jgi:hypothetical protein
MEEVQAAKHRNKPPITYESTYKKLMKVKKWALPVVLH